MVKVSIEVRSGAAHFDVAVQVESIQQAVSFVQERYSKGSLKVRFPIEPESFLVEDLTARGGIVGLEDRAREAA
jgi:hypothetical protein